MLLYWGMFTTGFLFGAIIAFVTFAPKRPQDDPEYQSLPETTLQPVSGQLSSNFESGNFLLKRNLQIKKSLNDKANGNKGNQIPNVNTDWLGVN